MRQYYELKIWVNDYSCRLFDELLLVVRKKLYQNVGRTFLRRGWQEGYHYAFIIDVTNFDTTDITDIGEEIKNYFKKYPSADYDHEMFREKYKIVSLLEDPLPNAFDIQENNSYRYQNITEGLTSLFENEEQLNIYFQLHEHFDHWFYTLYGNENNNLFYFIGLLLLLGANIPDRVLHEEARLYSNGFISHLSHYIGFLHSLNKDSREKVEIAFRNHYLQQRETFTQYLKTRLLMDQLNVSRDFVVDSLSIFEQLKQLFYADKISYFSPRKRDLKNNVMHPAHMAVFHNPSLMELVEADSTLVCYKWLLSTFYEKLPLLNISPKHKFYMNYFIYQFYQNDLRDIKSFLQERAMIYEEEITS